MNSMDRKEAFKPADSLMSPNEVTQLVIYMLRHPIVYKYAVDEIKPAYFTKEPHYKLVWRCVLEAAPAYGDVVPYHEIYARVAAAVEELDRPLPVATLAMLLATDADVGAPLDPDVPEEVIQRPGVIHYAHRVIDPAELDETYGLRSLKRFLQERTVYEEMRTAMEAAGDRQPGGFADLVDEMRNRSMRIEAVGKSNVMSFDHFPEVAETKSLTPTGVKILDYFMDGGQCNGETYLKLDPQKAGKTFTAGEIAVNVADQFYANAQDGGEPLYVQYLHYEMTPAEIRQRFFCRGASVNLDRLMYNIKNVGDMSRAGDLLPYEREMYKSRKQYDFDRLPGERERVEAFISGPGRHIRAADMRSGSGSLGNELLKGIITHLDREAAAGRKPGLLIVDYVNLAVRNYLHYRDMDPERKMRSTINQFMAQVVELHSRFDFPIWLIQQYSAEMQNASPAKKPSAAHAAEARTVGENMSFVFCGGKPKKFGTQFQVSLLGQDMGRRGGHSDEWRLAGLEFSTGKITDETDNYIINYDAGTIEAKAESAARVDAASRTMFQPPAAADPFKAAEGLSDDDLY